MNSAATTAGRNHDTLYKRGSGGEIRTWRMEREGNQHRVCSGVLNGTETASGWTTCVAKRGTTPEAQAEAEVLANYRKKLGTGYFKDRAAIDQIHFTKPMLAETYIPGEQDFPVLAQPKLDGMRCVARADGLWSRTGKPITTVPHIAAALAPIFADNPTLILDGELYHPDLKDEFGTLMSLARGGDPEGKLQYHIYDVPSSSASAQNRLEFLALGAAWPSPHLVTVETKYVANSKRLDTLFADWIEQGYEGQMVRDCHGSYENKRSKNLLKRKDFLSDEFPVIAVEAGEGSWAGSAKKFTVRLPDGRECGAGVRGNQARLKALLEGPRPTWATVRYFTPTPDGMPRFPVVTDWGFTEKRDD